MEDKERNDLNPEETNNTRDENTEPADKAENNVKEEAESGNTVKDTTEDSSKRETAKKKSPEQETSEQKPGEEKLEGEGSDEEIPTGSEPVEKADEKEKPAGDAGKEESKKTEPGKEEPGTSGEKDEGDEDDTEDIGGSITEYEEEQDEDHDEDEDEDEEGDEEDEDEGTGREDYESLSREALIEKLEELVREENISRVKSRIALIRVAFLRLNKVEKESRLKKFLEEGGNKEDYQPEEDDLETRFKNAFEVYKTNKSKYLESQEQLKQENLKKKEEILEKLRELINSEETLKKTYDEFRELQNAWKETGLVPAGEVSNLWQNYHFLVEKFFDKVKINKELRDLDLKKNLELKISLCEKTEELLLEKSIIKSFRELQKHHEEWKEIGPVPPDKRDEVWERFKSATDKINERRREYYSKIHEEQEKNLEAKTVLCEKAEELIAHEPKNMKEWQELTNQVNELFKIWRSIGRAPKKHNNEIWDRFKGSLNTFFSNKKEYFSKIKEEQLNNYNLKLDICKQAENIKDSTDWKNTTRELIALQKEWKKIGPVPRKHSDKIWKRFRAACDEFFNRKSEYFANIHEHEAENLKKKQEIINKLRDYKFEDDKNKNLAIIKDFQRQWLDIGFVPIKEKDRIQNEFRDAVNEQLDKLKISEVELDTMNFKARVESMKTRQDSSKMLRKERISLNNRISKLREDIHLWENNIGFLADSKKANLLREEFEKKIDKAKKDLVLLETKLKYIDR